MISQHSLFAAMPKGLAFIASMYCDHYIYWKDEGKIASMGSLVRYLLTQYVEEQSRYDDLAQYQDEGADVRLNVWVDSDLYAKFKKMTDDVGLTVTSAIKSLFCLYETDLNRRERVLAQ
jgi:hypothetical protein